MDEIFQSLEHDVLTRLSLKTVPISAGTARHLSLLIKSCRCLEELELSMQHITLDALRTLLGGVAQCVSIKKVGITGGFSMIQAKVLSSCLKGFGIPPISTPARIQAQLFSDEDRGCWEDEENLYRRFGLVGVTLVLEPSTFNDIAATVLYEGLESSTRVVDIEIRSSVANSHILTVLPRFRRRVQGVMKRNVRLVVGAQRQFEEVVRVAAYQLHVLQRQQENELEVHRLSDIDGQRPQRGHLSPTSRMLQYSSTRSSATAHRLQQMRRASVPSHADATPPSCSGVPHCHRDTDDCSSTTPSPHILRPPEPVQFREDSHLDANPTAQWCYPFLNVPSSSSMSHWRDGDVVAGCRDQLSAPPCNQEHFTFHAVSAEPNSLQHDHKSTLEHPFPAAPPQPLADEGSRPFQRHVIVEMATLRNIMLQQAKDIEDVRDLVLQIRNTDGTHQILRELTHLVGKQQEQQQQLQEQMKFLQRPVHSPAAVRGPPQQLDQWKGAVAAGKLFAQPRSRVYQYPVPPVQPRRPQPSSVVVSARSGVRPGVARPPNGMAPPTQRPRVAFP